MQESIDGVTSSSTQARSALLTTSFLAFAGSILGVFAILKGNVNGGEIAVVAAGGLYGFVSLIVLLARRQVPIQTIATLSTSFYAAYLCAGMLVAILGSSNHSNLFIYLIWTFTLLVFNKLVNDPAMGRLLAKFIIAAPLLIVCGLLPRVIAIFPIGYIYLTVSYSLSYLCFGLMLDAVTKYREAHIVDRERAKSLLIESEVLESISDCFIALDAKFDLVFLNDAACSEFAVERNAALHHPVQQAVPDFFSTPMLALLQIAAASPTSTAFEAQDAQSRWYDMRCFPKDGRISIYFRNITESVLSRQRLEAANERLREQSELLDKSQDAIFVQDMESRILYWNRGAERLFGWSGEDAIGRLAPDVFQTPAGDLQQVYSYVAQHGDWIGELTKKDKRGRELIVESRCTLVRGGDGEPRSILITNTDITARKAADKRIHNLAFHDVLTGLPNRVLLRERLETALITTSGMQSWGALLLIDLDDFKTLNDTSGHDVGDCLLQDAALRLSSCIRVCDTAARLGGDEFVVMLENLDADFQTAVGEVKSIGEAIVRACRRPYVLQHQEYEGTASVGATLFQGNAETVDELLKRADLAMYQAKAQGRNKLCLFDPAMESTAASRFALLTDLKKALPNGEFVLHYQPQVSSDNRVLGCEALLRWRHPQLGMVPPGEFIPLAEADGLIVDLGYWVLDTACSQLAAWAQIPEMQHLTMAVNVSIRQFLDSRFVHFVERALHVSGANPHRLKLEVTESFMMDRVDDVIAKMVTLKSHGIGFSMDDFGTGYSSLSQLKRLPLDQLKIDQSFVRDVLSGAMDASIVRTIIALGTSLHLAVIAEGVETLEQQQFLETHGCFAYQGYYFSRALPPSDFEKFVETTDQSRQRSAA